jgi:hypothetical protein
VAAEEELGINGWQGQVRFYHKAGKNTKGGAAVAVKAVAEAAAAMAVGGLSRTTGRCCWVTAPWLGGARQLRYWRVFGGCGASHRLLDFLLGPTGVLLLVHIFRRLRLLL